MSDDLCFDISNDACVLESVIDRGPEALVWMGYDRHGDGQLTSHYVPYTPVVFRLVRKYPDFILGEFDDF